MAKELGVELGVETLRATLATVAGRLHASAKAGVYCDGRFFVPDQSKAYVEFHLAHCLPVVNGYGSAIHHTTLARSWQSMRDQVFNLDHRMVSYAPGEIHRDGHLGTVVAVELGWSPRTGHTAESLTEVPGTAEEAPGLRCVAVIHKAVAGADKILGSYAAGREPWSVSLELSYEWDKSEFAIPGGSAGEGWSYIPVVSAPEALLGAYNKKKGMMTGTYLGRKPVLLMNGRGGEVRFEEVGLVKNPAEREAGVIQMLARGPGGTSGAGVSGGSGMDGVDGDGRGEWLARWGWAWGGK